MAAALVVQDESVPHIASMGTIVISPHDADGVCSIVIRTEIRSIRVLGLLGYMHQTQTPKYYNQIR